MYQKRWRITSNTLGMRRIDKIIHLLSGRWWEASLTLMLLLINSRIPTCGTRPLHRRIQVKRHLIGALPISASQPWARPSLTTRRPVDLACTASITLMPPQAAQRLKALNLPVVPVQPPLVAKTAAITTSHGSSPKKKRRKLPPSLSITTRMA